MMSVRREQALSWIDQLYVAPGSTGRGVGSELVAHAKRVAGPPIQLYTFQDNLDSRRFYERHGFTPIAFGDGSLNEEHCPDILYRWA